MTPPRMLLGCGAVIALWGFGVLAFFHILWSLPYDWYWAETHKFSLLWLLVLGLLIATGGILWWSIQWPRDEEDDQDEDA